MSDTLFSIYIFCGIWEGKKSPNLINFVKRSSEHGQWINAYSHMSRNRLAVLWICMPLCCPVSWIMPIISACLSFGVVLKRLLCYYKLMSHAVGYTFTATWWGLTDTHRHHLPDAGMRPSVHSHTRTASTWWHTGEWDERECEHMCVCSWTVSYFAHQSHH